MKALMSKPHLLPKITALALGKTIGPSAANFTDVPKPATSPDEILVKVRAVAINPTDYKQTDVISPPGSIQAYHLCRRQAQDVYFASIVAAVEEGRRIFDNIQKFALHALSENIASKGASTVDEARNSNRNDEIDAADAAIDTTESDEGVAVELAAIRS
ncbi:hypothetical protein B0J13DRAFT_675673 [Dactylonectria estremocensis]|uniref:Uncharacterized protein n=1 Tax=Dactylonectria estremocensis TaxID=1079267 RepID=A0A9P9ETT1_9HYPO|nr:hypothetical protein B0J13DRAFT_675673 [Dactylonectria estremocensis]